jgi:acetylornithine deacetylase/succinyl-diaminopimelate desuccinylase-like protein
MNGEQVLGWAAADAERSLELYRELLRIRSVWGDERELRRAAGTLSAALEHAGLEVRLADSGTAGMPMLLARLPARAAGGATLLLAGHMEVYPPSQSWTLDPWAATVRDGRVYGQGAADMKGGTAAMCAAAAALGRGGAELPGDLLLLAVPNHFEGGEGTRKALREGLRADAAVVCEPTDLAVVTGQRGILYLEITVRGRAAHTTALGIGVNAIERAASVVSALAAMGARDVRAESADARPIVNVAMVEGGIVHNIVPERCKLTVDIRFAPGQTAEDVLRDVRAAVADAIPTEPALATEVEPEATCLRNPRSSLRLSDDHPLVSWMSGIHAAATGRPAALGFHPAWPDTPILNEFGIPAVTYGPGAMECYWDDESVAVDDYLAAVRTYCLAAATGYGRAVAG